ncbi:hypothetical protein IAT38_006352 [Cryptococcus sp. DSM 104549]
MTLCMPESQPCPNSATRLHAFDHADSWYKAHHWALITAIASFIIIFVVGAINWTRRYVKWRPRKLTALIRGVGYRHVAFIDLSLGVVLAITTTFMALFIWCFAKKPYYRPGVEWGNPPLGIRSGYIAQGLVPFVFAMGSRINPLAWVTRVESGRWMIWHQYGARVILFFSTIHTFVILYAPYRQGGMRWTNAYWVKHISWKTFWTEDSVLLNGTFAFVVLVWIVFSSFAKIRNWNYEFFVIQHVLSIILFTVALWPHTTMTIPSVVYYVYASVAIWCFSIAVRIAWDAMAWQDMRSGVGKGSIKFAGRARLEGMGGGKVEGRGGVTKLVVDVRGRWEAGEHVWLRVPSINPFQSHPFTIASPSPPAAAKDSINSLTLLISTRSGLTSRLARKCASNPLRSVPVVLQGPYGGMTERLERFDRVLVIAGGVGAAFGWGIASQVGRRKGMVRMLWSVRSLECLEWFDGDNSLDRSNLIVHITGNTLLSSTPPTHLTTENKIQSAPSSSSSSIHAETPMTEAPSCCAEKAMLVAREPTEEEQGEATIVPGRCNLPQAVREYASDMAPGEKLAVIVCGPNSMLADVANAVSSLQYDILRGRRTLGEVWMHKERFGW